MIDIVKTSVKITVHWRENADALHHYELNYGRDGRLRALAYYDEQLGRWAVYLASTTTIKLSETRRGATKSALTEASAALVHFTLENAR